MIQNEGDHPDVEDDVMGICDDVEDIMPLVYQACALVEEESDKEGGTQIFLSIFLGICGETDDLGITAAPWSGSIPEDIPHQQGAEPDFISFDDLDDVIQSALSNGTQHLLLVISEH